MRKLLACVLLLASSAVAGRGFWMVNPWLQILYISDRPTFEAYMASGAQLYICLATDENEHVMVDSRGHLVEGVCVDPAPVFAPTE